MPAAVPRHCSRTNISQYANDARTSLSQHSNKQKTHLLSICRCLNNVHAVVISYVSGYPLHFKLTLLQL